MTVPFFIEQLENAYGKYTQRPGMLLGIKKYLNTRHLSGEDLERLFNYLLENASTLYGNKPELATITKAMGALGIIKQYPDYIPPEEKVDFEKPFSGQDCPERREWMAMREKMKKEHAAVMDKEAKRCDRQHELFEKQAASLVAKDDDIPF